jgi:hypothetical protein
MSQPAIDQSAACPTFQDPDFLADDLDWISDRAKLLTWTLDEMATAHFKPDSDNEWLWKLSMVFMRVIDQDLERAANCARVARRPVEFREAAE